MAIKRTSFKQQLLAVRDAARILNKPALHDAVSSLMELQRIDENLHTTQDADQVAEILERLFLGS